MAYKDLEKKLAYSREYERTHREEKRAYYETHLAEKRMYYAAHKDEQKEYHVRWAVQNRDKRNSTEALRRARKLGAFVENVDREVAFLNDAGVCQWQYCREASPFVDPANWHLDHIIALSRGGEHSYRNVQVTHPRCNQRKGTG